MKTPFHDALMELAERDERVFLLWGDVGAGLFGDFIKRWPKRQINMGVCEQSMVSIAAGMALKGLRPICYTITPFLIERAFEQIKIDVNQQQAAVGLVGYSDYGQGPTHRELDARRLMALCPNIKSYHPATGGEVKEIFRSLDLEKPWFVGLTKSQ